MMLKQNDIGDEDSPFNKKICDRCESAKPKFVCFDCGNFGSALCEQCTNTVHSCGSYLKHNVSF
jgi:hypothetical protein